MTNNTRSDTTHPHHHYHHHHHHHHDDDADEHSSGLMDVAAFSPGITLIFTVHVALISATIGRYRAAVKKELCPSKMVETDQQEGRLTYHQAKQVIRRASLQVIYVFAFVIVVTSVAVTQLTDPLDQRMTYIINGLSRLTAGVFMALLSFRVASWLELYHPIPMFPKSQTSKPEEALRLSDKQSLSRAVRWSVAKKFLRSFFWLLVLFQEGADTIVTIPVSIVSGVATGLFIDYVVYKCRRMSSSRRWRKCASVTLVLLLACFSVACFDSGVFFIASVWDDDQTSSSWPTTALVASLVGFPLLHLIVWQCGKLSARMNSRAPTGNAIVAEKDRHCTMTSMVFSSRDMVPDDEDDDSEPMEHDIEGDAEHSTQIQNHIATGNSMDSFRQDDDGKGVDESREVNEHGFSKDWTVCGCARGSEKTVGQKMYRCAVWTIYLLVCLVCFFVLIANIGSTRQQQAAKAKLPYVHEKLYKYIDEGPVCAFDNRGPDSNITTFPDKDAAHMAGFSVLHCGACGACSDWHNLELEYTTRNFLALESRKCAQKTLWGGDRDDLIECLKSDKIGFQGQCARCWADDILCTKKFCAFIGLQSFLINTLGNFEVGEDTITAAACEEAHCEAGNPGHFVACSGATRRRMNVTSTISRPGSQQCGIVDVTWSDLFPNPHPNDK